MRRSRTSVYLWFLTLGGFRRRTPGPPPFSSMNSTPAASSARRTAKSFAVVIEVSFSAPSARLIVASPRAASTGRTHQSGEIGAVECAAATFVRRTPG